MPCVRKRRGKWVIDFYDQFVKRHWESVGTNKKDAEEELAKRLLEVGKNTYCPQSKTRAFEEVAEEWFKTQIVPNKRANTAKYYRDHLNVHLLPYFSGIKLSRIDVSLIEWYMARKLEEGKIVKKTINKTVTTLGSILKYAVRHGFCNGNPVSSVQKLSRGAEEVVEDDKQFFTLEEIHLILEHADSKYGPLLQAAIMTGMREGELLGLMWDDIDWNSLQLHVRRTLQVGRFYDPKTRSSKRRIDVDPDLLLELKMEVAVSKGEPQSGVSK